MPGCRQLTNDARTPITPPSGPFSHAESQRRAIDTPNTVTSYAFPSVSPTLMDRSAALQRRWVSGLDAPSEWLRIWFRIPFSLMAQRCGRTMVPSTISNVSSAPPSAKTRHGSPRTVCFPHSLRVQARCGSRIAQRRRRGFHCPAVWTCPVAAGCGPNGTNPARFQSPQRDL